jgi:spore coat polysaccharide biosynthesis protein SpsF
MVQHVLTAAAAASLVDDVILATTTRDQDDPLAELAKSLGVPVRRGSETDVLGRFVEAIDGVDASAVVRLTGDNPLLDPGVIDIVVAHFLKHDCDYASNSLERSWPRGLDTEVITREALERSDREALEPEYREHVTLYARRHPDRFRLVNVRARPQESWPDLRLTIDTPEDLDLVRSVFDALYVPGRILRVGEVVDWLHAHPEVASLNEQVPQTLVFGHAY